MKESTQSWQRCRVGDSLTLINGRAFKPTEWKKSGLPIVRIQNLNDPGAPFNYYEGELPEKFLLADGDLLFAWSGTPGTSFGAHIWGGGKAWLNQHIFKVEFDDTLFDKRFLQLAINQNLAEYIRAAHGGAGLAHITKGRFEESEISCPPVEEQRRVVAEVEKQFTRLDAGIASLKHVQTTLKRYRASVLKAACEGRLVPTEAELARKENRSYETGEQLLQRILKERREKWSGKGEYKEPATTNIEELPSLPEGWTWATVERISNVVRGASPRPAGDPKYFGGTISWITVGPIAADETAYLKSVPETVTDAGRERSRYIEPHTLLLTNSGATLGVPKISLIGGCINDGVAALLDVDYPLKLYLLYFLQTQTKSLRGVNQGAAQPNLNTTIIKAINVPIPPLAEQQRIVAETERRLSMIEELEAVTSTELRRATRLRQSILRQAFSGRLATTIGPGNL